MDAKKPSGHIKITFHNPNPQEATAKFLIKIIADNLADYIFVKNEEPARGFETPATEALKTPAR